MRSAVWLIAASLLAGCVADSRDSSTTEDATIRNMLASNMLANNMLASNMLASNMLASNMLASNQLQINQLTADGLLSTADGRFLLQYITSCALPDGMNVIAEVPGAVDSAPPATPYTCLNGTCVFTGLLNLAPEWIGHKLDPVGRGWVSSCLLARVNANAVSEEISLRGRSSALAVSPAEEQLYSVQEGAFYGDVFTYPKPIVWIACEGEGQLSGTFGGLVDRKCARPDPSQPGKTYCGFTYAGYCGDYTPQFPSAYACSVFDATGGWYDECHGAGIGGPTHSIPPGRAFSQAITTYTTP
jgi:hypothetical protein